MATVLTTTADTTLTTGTLNGNYTVDDTITTSTFNIYDNFVGYSDINLNESTTMSIGNETFDMKTMFYLLKILMKKNDLDVSLLYMDFNELKEMMDRELKIDDLLK